MHSARVCASLATSRGRTSSLSGDLPRGNSIDCPRFAAELVRLKVDVIVAVGTADTRAAKEAPLRFRLSWLREDDPLAMVSSPVLRGREGRSLGCPLFAPELSGKRLELLKEIVPKLSRVAVFGSSNSADNAQASKEARTRRRRVRGEAAIPRHTSSQGY